MYKKPSFSNIPLSFSKQQREDDVTQSSFTAFQTNEQIELKSVYTKKTEIASILFTLHLVSHRL